MTFIHKWINSLKKRCSELRLNTGLIIDLILSNIIRRKKRKVSKRFIAVSMVKNESDIIELFIRINCRFFEKIYILDHLSDDTTPEIIMRLKAEGIPVEYILLKNEGGAYNQKEITTYYVNKIAIEDECDFIMPLDADEFVYFPVFLDAAKVVSNATSKCGYCLIPWVTYCPLNDKYLTSEAPLYNNFRPRSREPYQYYKVILERNFAKTVNLTGGNHDVYNITNHAPEKLLGPILQHVPVRSSEQIISKAVIGSMAYRMQSNRTKDEGEFYWDVMSEKAIQSNYHFSHKNIQEIASNYHKPKDYKGLIYIPLFSLYPKIGKSNDNIIHISLAEVNLEHNIKSFKEKVGS